jgi:hypothetical protein
MHNASTHRDGSTRQVNHRAGNDVRVAVQRWFESLEERRMMALVTTDHMDYHYGETALVSGADFAPNEPVQLQVTHVEGTPGSNEDPQNQAFEVQTDQDGKFTTTWVVNDPDALGATYVLTATGAAGDTAQATFTDSIANPVTIATAISSTSGTSFQSATFSAAVPVGNTVLVTLAMDPNSGTVSISDGKGNTYTKDADVSNGSGTSGVRTLIFSGPVTTALTTSDRITVTFGTATAVKVISVQSASGLLSASIKDQSSTGNGSTGTPNSGTTGATAQPDELLIAAIGIEDKNTPTAGSGYTGLTGTNTTGGASDTNIGLLPEYRIVSAAGTYSATSSAVTVPWAAALVTYKVNIPSVVSINRASSTPTGASSVSWTVTFSKSVTGVDAGDFALASTGAVSGASITSVTGGGTTWTVSANTGSGDGTLGLNLVDNDSIKDSSNNNPLGGTGAANGNFTGQVYTVDKANPSVASIVLANASPTNASSVSWTVTFSENVTGVDSTDFALITTGGVSGASITGVSGSGLTYTVTANTGSGEGTIGLNLVDNDSVIDQGSNPLGGAGANNGNFTGPVYSLDKTAPSVSINQNSADPTNVSPIHFTVVFSEAVTGFTASDVVLSGTANPTTATVTGSGTTYDVAVSGMSANGTVIASIVTGAAQDSAGNLSLAASNVDNVVTYDIAAPAAPVITGIVNDTGSSSSDGITSDPTLILNGTAEANSLVTVTRVGVGVIGTTTANGSGNWSFDYTGTTLSAGSYGFTATAKDPAGNTSVASSSFSVTVDITAPAAPAITGVASDTGSSTTDGITSDGTLILSGTAEANSTVTITRIGTGVIGSVAANGSGIWSFDYTGTTLTAGNYSFTATAADAAGNISATSGTFSITIDTAAPSAPSITGIVNDTGASSSDGITNDQTLVLNGTAEANSTVAVTRTGTGVIGTVTADGSGNWTFNYTGTTLVGGSYSFTATATDAAGNVSAPSATFNVTIDITAPATPAITGIATDTGSSSSDRITNDQTLVLSGTAEANSTVTVSRVGVGVIGTTTTNGSGNWSFDYTGVTLAQGSHSFTATATDVAGNISGASATLTVTIDITAPNAPIIAGIASDTGSSATDGITSDQTLALNGTAEANSTVTITRIGVGVLGTAIADGTGNWTFDYTGTTLSAGTHSFSAMATDAAGNASGASSTFTVTVDVAAPAAPVISGIINDTGVNATDGVTSDTSIILLGTAEANSVITVTRVSVGVIGTTTADASGNWSFDYTGTILTAGTYSFTGTAKDAAGNISAVSSAFTVTVDNVAPAAPAITAIASDTGTSSSDRLTNDQTLVLSGTAEANSIVTISRSGVGVLGTTTANGSGNWTFDYTGTTLIEGSYSFTATATDNAGNVSPASAAFTVTIDLTAPAAPAITAFATDSASLGDGITNDNTLTLSGTAEANSTVQLYEGLTLLGTTTATAGGAWSLTTTVLADGAHTFSAKAVDVAGNTGPSSAAYTVTVDTTAPAAPLQLDLADSSDTGGSQTDNVTFVTTPLFTGTAEANSTVSIFDGATALGTTTADASGNWSFLTPDVKALSSTPGGSSHVITAKATDAAGNVSVSSASLNIIVADQGKLGAVAVTNQAPKPVNPGGTAAYDLTLTRGDQKNSGGNLNIDLTVNWPGGIPTGVSILGPSGSHAVTLRSGQPVTTLIFRIATTASTPVGIYPFTITAGAAAGSVVGTGLLVVGFGADQGPNANNDTASTTKNTPVNINVVSNDVVGSLGSAFTVTSFTSGSNGIVTNMGGGVLKYTPVTNFTGTDTFTYTVTDANGLTDTALVTVFVDAGNIAPMAVADSYTTNESTALTISSPGVLANDIDPNGDSIVARLNASGGPTHGTLTLNLNGSFTYTPTAGFHGTDSFIYYADDGSFNSNEVLVTITIGAVNDAPENTVPGPQSVNEDTGLVFSSANGNAISISDPDADPNAVRVTISVTNGTLTLTGIAGLTFNSGSNGAGAMTVTGTITNINAALNGLIYNPAANFNGPVTLSIITNDLGNSGSGGALSDTDTVAITVNPINDPPVANNQTVNTNEDTAVSITLVATDIDSAGLTYSIVLNPLHGVLSQTSEGVYTYTPNANYNGTDTFTFKANDGTLDSNVATVTVNVLPVNDAPTVSGALAITNQHTPVTVTLSGADIDGDPITFRITALPANGSLYVGSNTSGHLITAGDMSGGGYAISGAQVTYLPGGEFFGNDSFAFVSFDGQASSTSANASITVNDITPPQIVLGGSTGNENDGQTQAFSWNVSDPSGLSSVLVTVKHDNVTVFTSASAIGSVNFDSLGLGLFEIVVDATDTAGNSSSASRSVTVSDDDTAGPVVDLSGSTGSETDGQTQNFGWNITDGSGLAGLNITVTRDGETVYSTSNVADAIGNFNFDSLGLGTYEMTVSATDTDSDRASDSLTTLATRTVTVTDDDSTAPLITLGGSGATENDGQNQTFTWDVTDAGSGMGAVTVSITKDGVEIFNSTDAAGTFDFNSYGLGTFEISASATDADNDRTDDALTSSATRLVTVSDDDSDAPVITLGGSDANETDAQDQVFTWNVTDAGSGLGSVSVSVTKDGVEIFTSTNASGSFDFNSLGLGIYEISVSATDADADRVSDSLSSSASRTVTVGDDDASAPVIVLGGSENTENDGQNQLFTWNVTDAGSGLGSISVSVTRDGVEIFTSSDAIGSFDFNSYGLGTFAISVSATDADADRASDTLTSSASRSVTVSDDDTTPPLIVLGGSESNQNDGQNQIFTWDVSDAGSGIGSILVSVKRDDFEIFTSSDLSGSFDFNSYGLGTYTISVSASDADADHADDALTSSASRTVVVSDDDTDAPVITLGGSIGSEVDGQDQLFTWNVTDAGSGLGPVSVSVTRDGVEIFTSSDVSGSFDFNSLGLGTYEINVTATDADGDRLDDSLSSSASRSVVVSDDDVTAPLIVLGGSDATENDGQDQTFSWNVSDAGSGVSTVTVSVTQDGVEIFTSSDLSGSFDFNSYGLGTFSMSVSATDADSDRASDALTSSATRTVVVNDDDTDAPVITLGGSEGAETDGQEQVFTWNVVDAGSGVGSVTVSVTRDGVVVFSSTDAAGSFDFNSLDLGTYEIAVSATDADGDRLDDSLTSSASQSVTVTDDDTAAPVITLGGSDDAENDGQNQVFTWDISDAGSGVDLVTVTITQDDAIIYTSSDLSGSFNFNGYGLGTFKISVSATDADADRTLDSLTSSASRTVVVSDDDTTPPAIVLSGSEADETDGQNQVFTWDVTDAGAGVGSVTVTVTKDGSSIFTSSDLAGSFDFNSYGLGAFAISVSATDADADRISDSLTSTASRSVVVTDDDTTGPSIVIGGSAADENDGQDQVFTWNVTDTGSGIGSVSVSVTKDGVEIFTSTDLSGSFDFNALGLGTYSISVTATDGDADRIDDAITTSDSETTVVSDDDTTAPVVILSGSSGAEVDGQDQSFSWSASDLQSGLANVTVSITQDGAEVYNSTSASGSFDFNSLGLGTFTMTVTAVDADADRADDALVTLVTRTVTVTDDDTTAPSIQLGGSTGTETDGDNQSFTWHVTDAGSGIGSVLVSITKDGIEIYSSTDADGSFDFNTYGLGTFQIDVSATDGDADRIGDALSSASARTVVVSDDDETPPVITLGGSSGSETDGQDQTFTWNVTDVGSGLGTVSVIVTRNGLDIFSSSDAAGSFDFNSYGLGTYTISVSATDADGDRINDSLSSSTSQSVEVSDDDAAAPIITLSGSTGDETDGNDQSFSWNVEDAGSGLGSVTVSITRDGIEILNSSDASGSFDFNSYGLGIYVINVTATDADGDRAGDALTANASRSASVTDDDAAAPIITLGGSDGNENDGQDQSFTWNVTDAGSGLGSVSVSITKDSVEIFNSTDASGSFDFNTHGLGTYLIEVTATDADGDRVADSLTATASRSVIVSDDDTIAPLIVVGGSEDAENDGQNQAFTWDVSDAGSGIGSVTVTVTRDGLEILGTSDLSGSFDFNSYGLGTYVMSVSATDADADRASDALTSTASQTVVVSDDDVTAPVITLGGSEGNETDGDNQLFTWNVVDAGSGLASVSVTVARDGVDIFTSTDGSGTFNFNSYGVGNYTINVSATDADGDRLDDSLTSSASRMVIVGDDDMAAPIIDLGGSTDNETDGQDQVFNWNITDAGSGLGSVAISITQDGIEIFNSTDGIGSFNFNSYGLGTFVMNVAATDADNDVVSDALSSFASRTVVVSDDDVLAPEITLGGSTSDETDADNQHFTWSVTDAGSGVGSVSVSITRDGVEIFTSGAVSGSFDFNTHGLGTYAISVMATDADSDRTGDAMTATASRSVLVADDDVTPPVIVLSGSEGDENDGQTQSFGWNISDGGSGLSAIEITITRDDGTGPVVIYHTTDLADAVGSFNFDSFGLGVYTISANAADADSDRAGDTLSSSTTQIVTVTDDDATPPVITLGGSAGSETDGDNQTFTWNVADAGSGLSSVDVTITRDGATIFTSHDATGSFDFNSFGLGLFEISVNATDGDADHLGDATADGHLSMVLVGDDDTAAPEIILSGSEGSENDGQNQNFSWNIGDLGSGIDSVNVVITRDGETVYTGAAPAGNFDFNSLGLGTFTITVTADDADADRAADSLSASASRTVIVTDDDTAAPVITLGGSNESQNDGQNQIFTWTVSDAGSGIGSVTVSVTLDGVEIFNSTNLSGSFDFNSYGLGTFVMNVVATDADNDRAADALTSSASQSVIVSDDDTTAPIITLGGSNSAETDAQDQVFTWNVTDSGSGVGPVSVSITRDSVEIFTSSATAGTFDFNSYGLGTYAINVTATDADDDRSSDSLTSLASSGVIVSDDDTASPTISLGGSSASENDGQTQNFTWDISDGGSGLSQVSIIITRDDGTGPVVIYSSTDLADAAGNFNFDSYGLGTYQISVIAVDADADRLGDTLISTSSRTVIVSDDDTTPPLITLGGSNGNENDGQNQVFTWNVADAGSGIGSVTVSITRNGVEIFTSSDTSGAFDFNSYGPGSYQMHVSATDADADRANDALSASDSRSVTVSDDDTDAPLISLGGSTGLETDGQNQHFTWNANDAVSGLSEMSVVITRDDGTGPVVIYSSTNLADATGSFDFNSYGLGTYKMTVSATDADSDFATDALSAGASRTVVISDDDTNAPVILISGSTGSENDGQDQSFTWSVVDSGSGIASISLTITRDDGTGPVVIFQSTNLADADGSFDLNSYGLGTYQISISATDADADRAADASTNTASRTVVVTDDDTTPPAIFLGGSTGAENDGQNQVFTWDVSDTGSGIGLVTVTIKRDGVAIHSSTDVTGSFDFNSFGLGTYVISVLATDADGDRVGDTLSTTETRSVVVVDDDAAAPVVSITDASGAQTDADNQVFNWNVTDAGSGIGSVNVVVKKFSIVIFSSTNPTGSFDFNSLGVGSYSICVTATDGDNDRSADSLSTVATSSVSVVDDDTTPPLIVLGGSSAAETDGQDQHFTWTVTDTGSGIGSVNVTVKRDGVIIFNSTSAAGSFNFNSYGLGTYLMCVTATDADDDRPSDSLTSTASLSTVVSDDDTAAPVITLGGSSVAETDGQDQSFNWNAADLTSGLDSVAVTVTRDGLVVYSSTNAAGAFDFNALGLGTYAITVSATDADNDRAGDSMSSAATRTVVVTDDDTDAPIISLGGSVGAEEDSQDQAFNWNITDAGSGVGTVNVSVLRNGVEIFTSTAATGTFDFNSYGLGTYKLNVSATDADNDRADDALGSSASQTVVVSDDDTTPPVILIGGSSGSETDGDNQFFTWDVTDAGSGVGSVTVTIKRDGATIHTSSDASGFFDFNTYGLGTYTISVDATDADNDYAGDTLSSSDSNSVAVSDDDTSAPSIFTGGSTAAESDGQTQSFDWNISDFGSGLGGLTVTVTRDGTVIYTTSNLDDASDSFNFDSFGLGTYVLSISANDIDNDRAGDALSTLASRTVVVHDDDATPPTITLGGSSGAENDGQNQVFNWNVTDAGSGIDSLTVSITRNGVEIFTSTDASGAFDFNTLGLGTYAISVSATDADNDRPNDSLTSSASRSVTVSDDDISPPVITLGGSTGTETDAQNQLFTWNVTDAGSGVGSVSVSITQNGLEIYNSSAPAGTFDFNSYGMGAFAITVLATDADSDRASDSLSMSGSRTVTVSDDDATPPTIILSGSTGTETDGQNQLFAWNASDATSGLSSFSITITRDDGSGPVVIYNSNSLATNVGNFDFNSFGLGAYTMTVSATDADNDRIGDSLTTVSSRTVTVSDDDTVAPLIILGGSVGTESHALTQSFNWNASDASSLSAVTVSITKDGVVILSSNNASGNFNFDAYGIGTFVITVSANDADNDRAGDSMGGSSTRQVIVNNNAPLARPAADQTINEGSTASFNGASSSDPDGDALNFHWDFGDGTFGVGMAPVHTYADNGDYTIIVTVTDIFGATSNASSKVHVLNVNPTGNVNSPATCLEGQNVGLTLGVSDPGADTFTYLWHIVSSNGQTIADSTSDTFNFVPNDEGTYTVTLTVTDDDGGVGIANKQVIVSNVAPKATNTGPQAAKQYSDAIIPITINATDPGAADVLTASIVAGLPANSGLALNWNSTTRSGSLFGKANLAPGNYNIDVRISDNDGGFTDTFIPLVVTQEDALVTYSGVAYVSTPSISSSTAVVTLRATIQDITAAYPGLDADAGDIRNATVTFVNRDTGAVIAANVPVTLLNSGDTKTGVATYDWTVNIGSADSQSITVGIVVNNYYTRNSALDNTVITVSKPLDSFISGGGYFRNVSSAGFLAGELGLRTNFGFNVKFNKSGTSLQGNVNIIVRSYNLPSGIRDTKLHVYQIKSTAISSLLTTTDALGKRHSTFVAKANVQDITDPNNAISVYGGLSLEMTVTDAGEPGSNAAPADSVGFTIWNGRTLIYSSDWTGTKTNEDILEGGNIQVHDQTTPTGVKK